MSTPIQKKRSIWVLPALVLWGFAPAIVAASSILGGWNDGDFGPAPSHGEIQSLVNLLYVCGAPLVLWPWSIFVLRKNGLNLLPAIGFGVPLAAVMCVVNLYVGLAGCSALSLMVPKEGIF